MTGTGAGALVKTQLAPSRAEALLEDQMADLNGAVAELLAHAKRVDPLRDEFGHARSRAYGDAVSLVNGSAKLGQTIAELRGRKFKHDINVLRQRGGAQAEADEEDDDLPNLLWLGDRALFDWRNKRTFVLQEEKPAPPTVFPPTQNGVDEQAGIGGTGDPPPESGGSNRNFGKSAASGLKTP